VHVEERGGLVQIQRVHGGVESRMDRPLFQGPQEIELAQAVAVLCPGLATEAGVVDVSGRAHIDTRNVASATVTVA
jgi:hypothetical protein